MKQTSAALNQMKREWSGFLLAVEAWGVLLACLPVRWPLSKVVVAYDIMWLFLEQSWMMKKLLHTFAIFHLNIS